MLASLGLVTTGTLLREEREVVTKHKMAFLTVHFVTVRFEFIHNLNFSSICINLDKVSKNSDTVWSHGMLLYLADYITLIGDSSLLRQI